MLEMAGGAVIFVGARNSGGESAATLSGDGLVWTEVCDYTEQDIHLAINIGTWSDVMPSITNKTFVITDASPPPSGDTITADGIEYELDWSDEFEGTSLDSTKWVKMIPGETAYISAYYNISIANPTVANSVLSLPIVYSGGVWYQAGVATMNDVTKELKKGFPVNTYIEARVKMGNGVLPVGGGNTSGVWSGGWFMPARQQQGWDSNDPALANYYYDAGGGNLSFWPSGGEIDWWETQRVDDWAGCMAWTTFIQGLNSDPVSYTTTVNKYLSASAIGASNFSDAWHTMSFHRFQSSGTVHMISRIDGNLIHHAMGGDFTTGNVWDGYNTNNSISQYPKVAFQSGVHGTGGPGSPFEKPFYLMFNSSVGGYGPVDMSQVTVNPANSGTYPLQIDWVHAYRQV
jgi:hypothetical protein